MMNILNGCLVCVVLVVNTAALLWYGAQSWLYLFMFGITELMAASALVGVVARRGGIE